MVLKLGSTAGYLQRALSRTRWARWAAYKIGNQCKAILHCHLNDGIDPDENGEYLLMAQIASTAQVFIDVGANVGNWSAKFLSLMGDGGKGILVEPNPKAVEALSQLKAEYGERLTVVEAAASDQPGRSVFFMEGEAGETSSFLEDFSNTESRAQEVEIVTIDALMRDHGIEYCEFLKIDAEGFDLKVMIGAGEYIRKNAFGVIQFEYNFPWSIAGSTLCEAIRILEAAGYSVFLIKKDGIYKFNYKKYGEFFQYANFAAVSKDWASRLEVLQRGEV